MKLFSLKPDLKIYFASDIHGSQKCFNKFINAGAFYGADTLIMGGDITGKSIVNIETLPGGKFRSHFMGKEEAFETEGEEKDFEKAVKTAGFYPYACSKEEWQSCLRDTSRMDAVFEQLMKRSLEEWFAFAERKLKGTGIRCYVMSGGKQYSDQSGYEGDGTWRWVHAGWLRLQQSDSMEQPEGMRRRGAEDETGSSDESGQRSVPLHSGRTCSAV